MTNSEERMTGIVKLAGMKRRRLSPKGRGILLIVSGLDAFAGAAAMLFWSLPQADVIVPFVIAAGVFFIVRGSVWLGRQAPSAQPDQPPGLN
jgi:hypothetical protein